MDLIEQFRKEWVVIKEAPLSLLIIAALLLIAMYALFRANLERKNDLIKTLSDQLAVANAQTKAPRMDTGGPSTKPELKVLMTGANIFIPNAPDMRRHLTGLAIDVRVWNTAKPSIATDWGLSVIAGGRIVKAQLTRIPDELRVSGTINSTVIHASQDLSMKTSKEPVGNTVQEGTLLFYVNLDKATVVSASTQLELSVKDENGAASTARQSVGDWLQR